MAVRQPQGDEHRSGAELSSASQKFLYKEGLAGFIRLWGSDKPQIGIIPIVGWKYGIEHRSKLVGNGDLAFCPAA
jgi:hypothetical protein